MPDYRAMVIKAVKGLKYIGPFDQMPGIDPHPLDCTLAGRVSHVFGMGMTLACELCRAAGEDPDFRDDRQDDKAKTQRR